MLPVRRDQASLLLHPPWILCINPIEKKTLQTVFFFYFNVGGDDKNKISKKGVHHEKSYVYYSLDSHFCGNHHEYFKFHNQGLCLSTGYLRHVNSGREHL